MPRILRNYLISFVIIGTLLGIIHALDLYFNPRDASLTEKPASTNLPASRE